MGGHPRTELTDAVDLCADGILNPAAKGWSRRPLHRANLGPATGRNKRWDYWAVLAGDLVLSCVYADLDDYGLADVYWADLVSGASGGLGTLTPPDSMHLPDVPGSTPLRVDHDGLDLAITDDRAGTRIRASWTDSDGAPGAFDVDVARPDDLESLNVVIPWSDELFNFTSKHQVRPAHGELTIGDRRSAMVDRSAVG